MKTVPQVLSDLKIIEADHLRYIKFELDRSMYHFGCHFKGNIEGKTTYSFSNLLRSTYKVLRLLTHIQSSVSKILSTSYVSAGQSLKSQDLLYVRPPWLINLKSGFCGDIRIFFLQKSLQKIVERRSLFELTSQDFYKKTILFIFSLEKMFKKENIKLVLLPNDSGYFEQCMIEAAKKSGIKSAIYLHGLPAIYNTVEFNQTDYLLVWGPSIKNQYINLGVSPNKVKVVGHPFLRVCSGKLRNSLDDILIISKSVPGAQFGHNHEKIVADRSVGIVYLLMIQSALQKLNVKSVRLRLHPGETVEWYAKHIDLNFFRIDSLALSQSLSQATTVIGPTSTVLLESIHYGVTYYLFEPRSSDNKDLIGYPLVAPFDGTEKSLSCFSDIDSLVKGLKDKTEIDTQFFKEWVAEEYSLEKELQAIAMV